MLLTAMVLYLVEWQAKLQVYLEAKTSLATLQMLIVATMLLLSTLTKSFLQAKKLEQKYYRYHTGYIGGLKEIQFKKRMSEDSDKALTTAVKGMLPKNSLGRDMIKKLKVFKGAEHNHQAQMPVELKF